MQKNGIETAAKDGKDRFKGNRVVVVGLGISGWYTARFLASRGASVTVSEVRPREALDPDRCGELLGLGVRLETGGHRRETFMEAESVIVSPGVPLDLGPVAEARARGIRVLGELELAARLIHTPMIAVTGTNGKSTVTSFIGSVLNAAGRRVFVGGNIGTPLVGYAAGVQWAEYAVVEVSSFQLDTIEAFSPMISIVLNVSPDHLDRYADYDAYVRSKLRIFENQGRGCHVLLNDGDPRLRGVHPSGGPTVHRYGLEEGEGRVGFLKDGRAVVRLDGRETVYGLDAYALPGRHNRENLLPVLITSRLLGLERKAVQRAVNGFRGLPNRLSKVAEIRGVAFYNDSKATNVDAAVRAVESLERPLVLIAGGRHKGADYSLLVRACRGRLKGAVFMGEAQDLLAEAFQGECASVRAADMAGAVAAAVSLASPGDAVLLAPACSSFDLYADYAERGRAFAAAVERLGND